MNWVITFLDNGRKPQTDGRMDGRTLTIPMYSPDFVGRDNKTLKYIS